jgi:hypothetical protein
MLLLRLRPLNKLGKALVFFLNGSHNLRGDEKAILKIDLCFEVDRWEFGVDWELDAEREPQPLQR